MTDIFTIRPAAGADPDRLSAIRSERFQANLDEAMRSAAVLTVLRKAADFIEEEAENRAAAGSEMSDYEREPRELAEEIRAVIHSSSQDSSPHVRDALEAQARAQAVLGWAI